MKFDDKLSRAYFSVLREQAEEVCPECGNNPCTCEQGACPECGNDPCICGNSSQVCICCGKNYQELIEDFSKNVSKDGLIQLLNIALNDELLATYNYMASYNLSKTEGKSDFDPEFEAHEKEEYEHAHKLINRLRELDAMVLVTPWCDIAKCNSSGEDWKQEFDSDSIAILTRRYQEEVAAVDFYSFILGYIKEVAKNNESEFDSTTHRLIKQIKADEEEHAKDLRDLLTEYGVEIDENQKIEKEAPKKDLDDLDDDDFEEPEEPEAEDGAEDDEEI